MRGVGGGGGGHSRWRGHQLQLELTRKTSRDSFMLLRVGCEDKVFHSHFCGPECTSDMEKVLEIRKQRLPN